MIELVINLPPTFALTSIHRRYDGQWCVCVHRSHPSEKMWAATHALGEHADIAEAARLAVERCEQKIARADVEHTAAKPSVTTTTAATLGIKINL